MLPNSTVEALELSVEMTPAEDFLKFNPPSRLDFQSLLPPLPREFPESHPSGGCGFFLEQPIEKKCSTNLLLLLLLLSLLVLVLLLLLLLLSLSLSLFFLPETC